MRIVLLVDPEIPVPPRLYGGIERIVDLLVRELMARGHEVTLFAHPDSRVACELRAWPGRSSASKLDTVRHMAEVTRCVALLPHDDLVVHSFARLVYMLPLLPTRLPKVQSYQREITHRSVRFGHALSRGSLEFTACSASCASTGNIAGKWHVIWNGVELSRYRFEPAVAADAPLMFLGRVERIKGPHHAIEVARRTGRRLIIAGNLPTQGPDVDYARELVAQCDGKQLEYVGPVDDVQKNALLGSAACLLMPIEWEEPFGIVMAEALACGTPVLGMRRGSVPEVIDDGVTGFICNDVNAMVDAVSKLPSIERAQCRDAAERLFSSKVIVDQYEALYRSLIAQRLQAR